jgi:hypothetical protein
VLLIAQTSTRGRVSPRLDGSTPAPPLSATVALSLVRAATADVTRDRCHGSSTAGKHHLMQMSFVFVYFMAFALLAFVVGPALRTEDRPAFKRPDKKVRWLF